MKRLDIYDTYTWTNKKKTKVYSVDKEGWNESVDEKDKFIDLVSYEDVDNTTEWNKWTWTKEKEKMMSQVPQNIMVDDSDNRLRNKCTRMKPEDAWKQNVSEENYETSL